MRQDAAGFAGAKVNLYLHVGPLALDGYHPINSLMVFADSGDRLTLTLGDKFPWTAAGPFADAAPMTDTNLVVRAARLLTGEHSSVYHLHLQKNLPVAAGIGGGSADAAAALRLVNAALELGLDERALCEIGLGLGADVPACVMSRALIAQGRGERLTPVEGLPVLHAVLVNPGVPTPTGAVFRAFDEEQAPGRLDAAMPVTFADARAVAAWLATDTRNDLEPAARRLVPAVGEVIDYLAAAPQALLARMSGSGATTFALCAGADEAAELLARVNRERPGWWAAACVLS